MSKAILVMDMPKHCLECPMRNDYDDCVVQSEEQNDKGCTWELLRKTCPLREVPEKQEDLPTNIYRDGWNACIDRILGGSEEHDIR